MTKSDVGPSVGLFSFTASLLLNTGPAASAAATLMGFNAATTFGASASATAAPKNPVAIASTMTIFIPIASV